MDVCLFVIISFLINETNALQNGTRRPIIPFPFVAAIVSSETLMIVATGAVISPHWVLTSAHSLADDTQGLSAEDYFILAGRPMRRYTPSFVLSHPTYTWGLYTAEDMALFRVPVIIETRPVMIIQGRFPWNVVDCDFIYWNLTKYPFIVPSSMRRFSVKITVVPNCMSRKRKSPVGILQFYLNDILCGTAFDLPHCVGNTGGLLFCESLLVGLLIRQKWCENKTANFTDIGSFTHWLVNRVSDGRFIHLTVQDASSNALPNWILLLNSASFVIAVRFIFGAFC